MGRKPANGQPKEKVKRLVAIRRYFSHESPNPPDLKEIKDFLGVCTEAEKKDFGKQAAKILNLELDE